MSDPERFKTRYNDGDIPWDLGRPDVHLTAFVTERRMLTCPALDIGCGTGSDAVWLAGQGFSVTGIDVSETAIERARERAADSGVECEFLIANILSDPVTGGPFGLAFDRGCFHTAEDPEERLEFARRVAACLTPGGLWMSILGNADDPPRDQGPPMRTAAEIAQAAEPFFEILSIKASVFDSNRAEKPRSWVCLMRVR